MPRGTELCPCASAQAGHESPPAGWKHSWTEEPSGQDRTGQAEPLGLAGTFGFRLDGATARLSSGK